ncbi:hypothetical protein PR048_021969 [Dryococelus australis]|uniref:Uncharacterized protein n=1 Tax=Dryococelus australis TaxID=614101 RepID=A0ABQ9GZP3_9NEOP|nr:hypothetical protein PR048_021969 [Dryococelus australis]
MNVQGSLCGFGTNSENCSYPVQLTWLLVEQPVAVAGMQVRRRKGKLRMAAEGAQKLFEACKEIVQDGVDLVSWQNKIREEMELEYEFDELEVEEAVEVSHFCK